MEASKILFSIPELIVISGIIIWFIRLESKVVNMKLSHDNHKAEVKEKIADHKSDIEKKDAIMWAKVDNLGLNVNSIMQSLARIEERLNSK